MPYNSITTDLICQSKTVFIYKVNSMRGKIKYGEPWRKRRNIGKQTIPPKIFCSRFRLLTPDAVDGYGEPWRKRRNIGKQTITPKIFCSRFRLLTPDAVDGYGEPWRKRRNIGKISKERKKTEPRGLGPSILAYFKCETFN